MAKTDAPPSKGQGLEPYLTTEDNPYDPRDEFKQWYAFDRLRGYNTVELLDRVLLTSELLSPADQRDAELFAMEEIVAYNLSGVHKIVYRPK